MPFGMPERGRAPVCDTIECEQAELLISRRLDGELSPHELPRLEEHLKICGNCREHSDAWTDHSTLIDASLNDIWPRPRVRRAGRRATSAPRKTRLKRCMWVPVGMIGSQVAAFLALSVYFVFFQNTVEAPRLPARDAARVEIHAALSSPRADTEKALAVSATPLETPASPIEPLPPAVIEVPAEKAAEPLIAAALAAPQGLNFNEVPQVSMNYAFDDDTGERSGRIVVLGDLFSGKAVVRVIETGKRRDVAQADVGTLLEQPLRSMVQRFLEECARPQNRERLQRALDRAK